MALAVVIFFLYLLIYHEKRHIQFLGGYVCIFVGLVESFCFNGIQHPLTQYFGAVHASCLCISVFISAADPSELENEVALSTLYPSPDNNCILNILRGSLLLLRPRVDINRACNPDCAIRLRADHVRCLLCKGKK